MVSMLLAAVLVCAVPALEARPPANVLAFNLGVGSAVGTLGVTYAWSGLEPLELELGLGVGYSGSQGSLMAKLASTTSRVHKVTTGVGAALTLTPGAQTRGNPVWLNADVLGYEYRGASGFFFGASAGFYKGLGGGGLCVDCEVNGGPMDDVTHVFRLQVRAMMGVVF
jgi:hypothetical protein